MRFISAALATVLLAFNAGQSPAQHHLEPEDGSINESSDRGEHARRIRETLLKDTPFYNVARMICSPALEPEWVVTVVGVEKSRYEGPRSYFVEYVAVDKKLYGLKDYPKVKVKKSRVDLDRRTAHALDKVWREMLMTTRYAEDWGGGADGETYHFSRGMPQQSDVPAGWLYGKIWSPDEESLCGHLVEVGKSLRTFATAPPNKQWERRKELREVITRLQDRLDVMRQNREPYRTHEKPMP